MFQTWLKNHRLEDFDFSVPLLPAACERSVWQAVYDAELVKSAEQYLAFDWPVIKATDFMAFKREGNRVKQENPHFLRRQALGLLVLAETLEYKSRFLPDIVNGLFAVCEETYWGLSAHWPTETPGNIPDAQEPYIDLFAAETAAMLAWAEYMLYDALQDFCPEIIERIEYELERRTINPYLSHRDFWWMGYHRTGINNWNPWILSNILSVFLLTEKKRYRLEAAIEKMFLEIQYFYDSYAPDGGCDEGANYWTVAGASLFEFVDQLYTATGGAINFFTDEKIRNMGRFAYHIYIGNGYFVNYADGPARMTPAAFSVIYHFGKRIGDQRLMCLAKEVVGENIQQKSSGIDAALRQNVTGSFLKSEARRSVAEDVLGTGKRYQIFGEKLRRGLYACLYRRAVLESPDFVPETEVILPDLQVAVMRRGAWFVSVKGGHNSEGHNHNDVGNFIAYFDKKPVLIDAGVGVYTRKTFSAQRYEIWSMQSSWHNCPEINGAAQCTGRTYAAGAFALREGTIEAEFSGAYPKDTGLTCLTRKVTPAENAVVIEDACQFEAEKNQITEYLLTPLPAEVENGTFVLAGGYMIEAEGDVLPELLVEKMDISGDANFISSWRTDTLFRLAFRFSAEKTAEIKIVLRRTL